MKCQNKRLVEVNTLYCRVASKTSYFLISENKKNPENGTQLSRRELVESLENIHNNRTTGFVNRAADSRSIRSMSRTSSVSNLETIHEGNEPEEPEVFNYSVVK